MPTRAQETNARRFLAGSLSGSQLGLHGAEHVLTPLMAGVTSVFFTYPLEVIRVRMAFETRPREANGQPIKHASFTGTARLIFSEGAPGVSSSHILERYPVLKLYRGFTATVAGMIPYAGVSFLSWGFLRSRLLPPDKAGHKPPTPIADLAIGAVSGLLAQTASYPLEVIRRRMQVGGITRPERWLRWGETVQAIWRASGWRGFYVGLGLGYLKVVPMTAVSFTVWQGCKRLFNV